MGTSFVENLPKSCFLFALLPTKWLATSTRFIASVLQVLDLFDLTLVNVYVRNVCHSIGEINLILFLRLLLQQWA